MPCSYYKQVNTMSNTLTEFHLTPTIKKAFLLYRASLKPCFWIAFVYSIFNQLLSLALPHQLHFDGTALTVKSPALLVGIFVLTLLLFVIATAMIMLKQQQILFQTKAPHLMQQLLPKLPILILASIIVYFFTLAGYLLYILPGLAVATCFYFYLPSILFADQKALGSLKYSFQLIKPHVWTVLGLVLFNLVVISAPIALIAILFHATAGHIFGIKEALTILLQALLLPLATGVILTAFHQTNKQLTATK